MKLLFIFILCFSLKICFSQDSINVLHPEYKISLGKLDVSKIEQNLYQLKALKSLEIKSIIDSTDCIVKSFDFWLITEDEEYPIGICKSMSSTFNGPIHSFIGKLKINNKIYLTHIIIIHNGKEINLPDLRFIAASDK